MRISGWSSYVCSSNLTPTRQLPKPYRSTFFGLYPTLPRQERLQALLAEVRKARKLTQSDVAERLDRPQSLAAKYEGGERRLDVVEFVEVAEALETDPCALLSNLLRSEERRGGNECLSTCR